MVAIGVSVLSFGITLNTIIPYSKKELNIKLYAAAVVADSTDDFMFVLENNESDTIKVNDPFINANVLIVITDDGKEFVDCVLYGSGSDEYGYSIIPPKSKKVWRKCISTNPRKTGLFHFKWKIVGLYLNGVYYRTNLQSNDFFMYRANPLVKG